MLDTLIDGDEKGKIQTVTWNGKANNMVDATHTLGVVARALCNVHETWRTHEGLSP